MVSTGQSYHHVTTDSQVLIRGVYSAKPLYFFNKPIKTKSGRNWLVSSSLRELGSVVNNRPDPAGLRDFLCYGFVPAPRTIFEDIFAVPPGMICSLPFADDQPVWSYSQKTQTSTQQQPTETTFWDQLCALITREHCTVLLSGGIDSAIVAAAAKSVGKNVNACHARFAGFDVKEGSSTYSARMIAKHLQLNYRELVISSWDVFRWFDRAIKKLDQPLGASSILPFYLMFKTISKQTIQTVLTGQGGNQLLGSGFIKPMILRELYPEPTYSRELAYLASFNGFPDEYSQLMSSSLAQKLDPTAKIEDPIIQAFANTFIQGFCDKLRWVDIQLKAIQHILPGIEAMAQSCSLKLQHPFLQEQLIEQAFALPERLKLSGSQENVLLNRLAESRLPTSVLTQHQHGMNVPANSWITREFWSLATQWLNKSRLQKSGLLNPDYVQEIRQQPGNNIDYHGRSRDERLWMLCVLECWFASLS